MRYKVLLFAVLSLMACRKEEVRTIDVELDIPSAQRRVSIGETITIYSYNGKNPLVTDEVLLVSEGDGAGSFVFPITGVSPDSFTFNVGSGFVSGAYQFFIKRGDLQKLCGNVNWILRGKDEPEGDSTLYGSVTCGGQPVSGVQVTDGYEVVLTDADGKYEMKSEKKNGYVYITVPSGYEVDSKQSYSSQSPGILPLFWHKISKAAASVERIDFKLYESADQTNHTALFFGDMHLAGGKQNDLTQFAAFVNEVNGYASSHSSEKIYAFTLGDMTWDLYWYDKNYCFAQYLSTMSPVTAFPIFHTIGNHDHNMKTSVSGAEKGWDAVDWDTAGQFRSDLGPNYFSVNIGKIHYVMTDNIFCTNTTGGLSADRKYSDKVSPDCIAWLKKDLANTDKSCTVVITGHAPFFTDTGGASLDNLAELKDCLAQFKKVVAVTGHTHKMYTVNGSGEYSNISEHNSGAVCAAWWWAGYYDKDLNIAQDGAPGGYRIMSVNGTSLTSYFKGTGFDSTCQFRTYDRNCIDFSSYTLPSDAEKAIAAYKAQSSQNYVYINVWDWSAGWKISVTETDSGKTLTPTKIQDYDPLYSLAYVCRRYSGKTSGDVSFGASLTRHLFRVQASSATSTLLIEVTDDEGRTYTETMERPKAFNVNTYKHSQQ